MKVYNTRPVSLTVEVYFLDHRSIHLFQSNQRFQAIEFADRRVPEKLYSLCINIT